MQSHKKDESGKYTSKMEKRVGEERERVAGESHPGVLRALPPHLPVCVTGMC